MSPKSLASPIAEPILTRIGLIASSWSALEAQLEFAILRHQEIDLGTGMLLTANLGYRSKVDLLTTFANEGGITPETEAKALLRLLGRANVAYGERNLVVHSVWSATDNPLIGRIQGVRTKGKLRVLDEPMSVNRLNDIAEEIVQVGGDIFDFMKRHNLSPENGV